MESKVCVICNTEKGIHNFYNKCRKCKECKLQRSTKLYWENEDKLSKERKKRYELNRDESFAKSKLNSKKEKVKEKYINNKYKNSIKS